MANKKLSEHFTLEEFACRCGCGEADADPRLIASLEALREAVHAPIHINSGRRCEKQNKKVGGSPNSQHLTGKAADIWMENVTPQEIARQAAEIEAFRKGGIGVYPSFVHLDVRPNGPARWGLKWRD
ncbi:MAG: D-Ala-D-Ala carboxypeptidase family metallohydrolase [Candidatus Omnitrophota bacterium]